MSCSVASLDVYQAADAGLMGNPVLCDWLRAIGIDPDRCREFEVLADGDGHVVADLWLIPHCVGPDNALRRETVVVPLTAPIPPEVLAAGRP